MMLHNADAIWGVDAPLRRKADRDPNLCNHGVHWSESCQACRVTRMAAAAKSAKTELAHARQLRRRVATLQRQLANAQGLLSASEDRLEALLAG